MFSIAIIDDSPVIQERLADRLKSINGIHKVYHAGNKVEALAIMENDCPTVAILDLQLPDGTGIEILQTSRHQKLNTIWIVLTNFPYSVLRKRCESLGASYFFDKSTEFHEVMNVIESIVQGGIASSSADQKISNQYM
jgi:DNA-binding NarL/FixJ family response regulator